MVLQQRQMGKRRGVADVMFVLDNSGSMSQVYEGIRDHIRSFVEAVEADPQRKVDWRIGFLSAGAGVFEVKDFTDNVDDFKKAISKVRCSRWDEYTLPALDYALDMSWRPDAYRFIVLFTDEPISGGAEVKYQMRFLEQLKVKMQKLRIKFIVWAPECPAIKELSQLPNSIYSIISGCEESFVNADFSELLSNIGKTVSSMSQGQAGNVGVCKKDIYGLMSGASPVTPIIKKI